MVFLLDLASWSNVTSRKMGFVHKVREVGNKLQNMKINQIANMADPATSTGSSASTSLGGF